MNLYKGKLKIDETPLVYAILQFCHYQENLGKLTYIRNNTGQAEYEDRQNPEKKRKVNYGRPDSPDILIFIKGGITLFFECKSSDGKVRPGQVKFGQRLKDLGHRSYVLRDPQTAMDIINEAIKGVKV
jgi:hypothetical protein